MFAYFWMENLQSGMYSLLFHHVGNFSFLLRSFCIPDPPLPCIYCTCVQYVLDVLWGQLIKLIQVVTTSEFHEY